jgi:hypothetical protein
MATQETTIYNSTLNPTIANLSDEFTRGIGFYLTALNLTDEVEIDIFLQLYLTPTKIRAINLESLNVSTTERLTLLPPQLRDIDIPMRLLILPSETFNLNITLLQTVPQQIASPIEDFIVLSFGAIAANQAKKIYMSNQTFTPPVKLVSLWVYRPDTTDDEVTFYIYKVNPNNTETLVYEEKIESGDSPVLFPPALLLSDNAVEIRAKKAILNCFVYLQKATISGFVQL